MKGLSILLILIIHIRPGFCQEKSMHKYIDSLIDIGNSLDTLNLDESFSINKKALKLSQEHDYDLGIADAKKSLGNILSKKGDYSNAQKLYFEALSIYEELGDQSRIAQCELNISSVFYYTNQFEQALKYAKKLLKYYESITDSIHISSVSVSIAAIYNNLQKYDEALKIEKYGLKYITPNEIHVHADLLMNLSSTLYETGKLDSAYLVTTQALQQYYETNNFRNVGEMYFMLGLISEQQENTNIAIAFYHKSLSISDSTEFKDLTRSNLEGLMLCHGALGNVDSLYFYYDKLFVLQDELNEQIQNRTINELQIQYDTKKNKAEIKLQKELLNSQDELLDSQDRMMNLLVISIVLLAGITLIVIVYFRQKQRLAKLELNRKNEEVIRIIKEQEVLAYESQLEGEAHERTRVARELHDSVGGLLATINLHCEALKTNMDPVRVDQMQELLKSTISEVRTISHNLEGELHTGGLQSTLEHLGSAIDSSGRIKFALYYELGKFKPSLSLSKEIVKIIQELVTNTIKHADASEITAQFSNPGNNLQIIYEDNGKGFEVDASKDGIGMKNIAKRIQSIDGHWNVDSQPGYGTTVVIEIPLRA